MSLPLDLARLSQSLPAKTPLPSNKQPQMKERTIWTASNKNSSRRTQRQDAIKNISPSQTSRSPDHAPPAAEEEEERSLLEPRARPQTLSQPPPVEEDQGPKSRLVIHKMVLINFKSYAGRQEIGPFHKVRLVDFTLNYPFSYVLLVDRWSKRLGKIKHDRCTTIRVPVPRIQNASREALGVDPQLCPPS